MYEFFELLTFGIASVFFYSSYISLNTKATLVFQIISIILFSFGLYLHGVKESSLLISLYSLIPMVMGLIFPKKIKDFFSLLVPFIGIVTLFYASYDFGTILTIIASFFGMAAALQSDVLKMKILYFVCNSLWLMFDFYIVSVGAVLFDIVGMIALILFFKKKFYPSWLK